MNSKYLAVVAALAVMLVAATAFATTDSVFAGGGHGHKKHYGKSQSQAVSQANACGNGSWAENVWCQNTASQIQGKYNDARLSSAQGDQRHGGGYGGGNGGGYGGETGGGTGESSGY